MKGLLRRAAAALMAACLVSLSAFSVAFAAEEGEIPFATEGTPAEDENMVTLVKQAAMQLLSLSREEIIVQQAMAEDSGDETMISMIDALLEAKIEYGTPRSIDYGGAQVNQVEDGTYTAVIPVTYEDGQIRFMVNVDPYTGYMQVAFASGTGEADNASLGDQMKDAGVYAGFGLGTVFIVLIVISLIIAAFKFIHNAQEGKGSEEETSAPAPVSAAVPAPVPAPAAVPAAGEDLMDDTELLLLITTAIAAYESVPANGLKVRSIRRAKDARWKRS
ncbi:MAG: OadG family protein [Lachnospiraceae bacterium]|uniref:OadG family protein n=1 Tax=Candidatus Enterocloster excrementigallinarum TaxID=2838558 RepID=A0A9D2TDV1_9FIRM|nr:OadG family protein [Lachnospiraceae bacterium]HJC65501.1 OadG family protein [Candidatus Enterocloster excrementigallinarum]